MYHESIHWFLNSPIYVKDKGYREFYSATSKSLIYPEITAYAINLCCILYKRKKQKIFLERAEQCAKYLISISKGGIPNFRDDYLYTFDTGIYISALLDLYQITKNKLYFKEAKKSLNWLLKYFDGEKFKAINKETTKQNWDHKCSIHLTKLAIPLLKAFLILKNKRYKEIAIKLLEWAKTLQKNGRFLINKGSNLTITHPHCYATEAFLFAAYVLKNKEYLQIAKNAALWLAKKQNKDGSFYLYYPYRFKIRRKKITDAVAQAIRVWKILGIDDKKIEKANLFLQKNLINGGLRLFINCYPLLQKTDNKIYSWPTIFYIHSLIIQFNKLNYTQEIF